MKVARHFHLEQEPLGLVALEREAQLPVHQPREVVASVSRQARQHARRRRLRGLRAVASIALAIAAVAIASGRDRACGTCVPWRGASLLELRAIAPRAVRTLDVASACATSFVFRPRPVGRGVRLKAVCGLKAVRRLRDGRLPGVGSVAIARCPIIVWSVRRWPRRRIGRPRRWPKRRIGRPRLWPRAPTSTVPVHAVASPGLALALAIATAPILRALAVARRRGQLLTPLLLSCFGLPFHRDERARERAEASGSATQAGAQHKLLSGRALQRVPTNTHTHTHISHTYHTSTQSHTHTHTHTRKRTHTHTHLHK